MNSSGEGDMINSHGLQFHLNCLVCKQRSLYFVKYSASGLVQRVNPSTEVSEESPFISGFNVNEIKDEIRRGSRIRCSYCNRVGACVGCSGRFCRYSFHLPCLYEARGFVCFKHSFEAFCWKHRPEQDLRVSLLEFKDSPPTCCICLFGVGSNDDSDEVVEAPSVKSDDTSRSPSDESNTRTFKSSMEPQHLPSWIPSICRDAPGMPTGNRRLVFPSSAFNAWSHGVIHGGCCRLSWMHRDCVAAYACSAGLHHIKCPICSNREAFINTIIDFGVWVPDRDASWELESTPPATPEPSSSGRQEPSSRSPAPVANQSRLRRRVTSMPTRPPPTSRYSLHDRRPLRHPRYFFRYRRLPPIPRYFLRDRSSLRQVRMPESKPSTSDVIIVDEEGYENKENVNPLPSVAR